MFKRMSIGALKTRIAIERQSVGQNEYGERVGHWLVVANLWACVVPVSGGYSDNKDVTIPTSLYQVYVRYNPSILITDRINANGVHYTIDAIMPYDGKRYLCLTASRVS